MNANESSDPRSIGCFCHVPKTAGTTMSVVLRRHFGLRHLDVVPQRGIVFDTSDLRALLRVRPGLTSVAGHGLRPCHDYGEFSERLAWYTVLRDPVKRVISNYQYQIERHEVHHDFIDWMRLPHNCNWHVRMFAEEQNLELAKETLATRFRCVGLLERFNEYLLILRRNMGWDGMRVSYGAPKNTARKGEFSRYIRDHFDKYRDVIHETNQLDIQLYDFVRRELYPGQVERYGEAQLRSDLETEFVDMPPTLSERAREFGSNAFRRWIYKPVIRVNQWAA